MKVSIILIALWGIVMTQSAPTLPPTLLKSLETTNRKANILLSMTQGSTKKALQNLQFKSSATREDKLNAVYSVLKAESDGAQAQVLEFLQTKSITFRQLWISNQIIVKNADFALVQELSTRSDISTIQEEESKLSHQVFGSELRPNVLPSPNEEQWGVTKVNAPAVWANGTKGQGVIVATIDTGVRGTHESVRDSYKGDEYSFFAPDEFSTDPSDGETHGTHTMSTIVGSTRGVGVAPSAKWIACKWCGGGGPTCTNFGLLECGQWIACPTKADGSVADCTKAPHIVSNSWAWGESPWYDAVLEAWKKAEIIPIFAIGNSGSRCETTLYPGDTDLVIAVGATTIDDDLASFSSIGPSPNGLIRPDVSAPGEDVFAAYSSSDDSYGGMSGTSMACPHAAGVATLLLSRDPTLKFDDIKRLLEGGAGPINPRGTTCGGVSDDKYPNNHHGHGQIDAWKSYQNIKV